MSVSSSPVNGGDDREARSRVPRVGHRVRADPTTSPTRVVSVDGRAEKTEEKSEQNGVERNSSSSSHVETKKPPAPPLNAAHTAARSIGLPNIQTGDSVRSKRSF